MNRGQEMFLNFIMQHVKEDSQQTARQLLEEAFAKQQDGSFRKMYLMTFIPRMLACIKPESVEQVKQVMTNFKP